MSVPEISIVIPIHNEEENLRPLVQEIKEVLDPLGRTYEILFVDDGSTDSSFSILRNLHEVDGRVKILKLRRNFGKSAALKAGFDHARGKVLVTIDGDLQNDPKDIPRLLERLHEGYDIVSGWRKERRDPLLKVIPSKISNHLHRWLTGIEIHDSGCGLKAFRRECLENIELYGEMHRYIPAILAWQGYRIGELEVSHRPRTHGRSKYNWQRLAKGFLDLLNVAFWQRYHTRPLHLMGGVGLLFFVLGFLIALFLTVQKIFLGVHLSDRPMLLLAVLMIITGMQLVTFGFLAEIMVRTYFRGEKIRIYSVEVCLE